MLRRRRPVAEDQADTGEDIGHPDELEPARDVPEPGASGPWDAADDYPRIERADCGSLQVPLREGFDVQIHLADEMGVWVAVIREDSGMQLQAFAAPKTMGLWDEIRQEIAENITATGGRWEEAEGPVGDELRAWVPAVLPGQPAGDDEPLELQPVRFLGADGPRWFLRGVISGQAAMDEKVAAPFEELFADVVVVRGDHPAPPREQLEIRLPQAAQEALEAEMDGSEEAWELLNPFERGPEITEIR